MLGFILDTAQAAVDITCDTAEMVLGGDPPKREDVAQLLAAGLTVGAIAVAFDVSVDVIEDLVD